MTELPVGWSAKRVDRVFGEADPGVAGLGLGRGERVRGVVGATSREIVL
jgi:hypothetical protein